MSRTPSNVGPIAVGGVGGSGTRVVAAIVRQMGVFFGDNLNHENDNLDYPGLERSVGVRAESAPFVTAEEMAAFATLMQSRFERGGTDSWAWGWKNPPTYLSLSDFAGHFPSLRYVHVIRNGLDMAFSANHNQVRRWGHLFGISYGKPSKSRSALAYWVAANDLALAQGVRVLGERFHLLVFDELVEEPEPVVWKLAEFLELNAAPEMVAAAVDLVGSPPTVGRHRDRRAMKKFGADELAAVERFGFGIKI